MMFASTRLKGAKKDRLGRSLMSKVICKASCWDRNEFCMSETKCRLNDGKSEHFKALLSNTITSALADNLNW